MKVRFNRWYNTLLTALLSLLGYGCSSENSMEMYGSPILMYGVPSAEYKISGTVTDEGGKAVEGIKTSVKQVTNYEGKPITFAIDSVLTDANGHYDMTSTHFPQSPEIKLIVEDVDGDTNGAYQNDTIDINYNNVNSRVVLEMGDGGVTLAPGATGTYYVMVPPYNGTATFSVKIRLGADGHSSITKTTSNPVQLDRNMIVSIVTNETPVEDNEISGYYSISPTCKVVFSKGNLQHWASDENNWHFAENQYDYYGSHNLIGESLGNVVDLFYWSLANEYWDAGHGSGQSCKSALGGI